MIVRRLLSALLALLIALAGIPALAQSSIAQTPLGASSENKLHNIRTAAGALSGWVILSGETFSFNEAVGPRTAEEGYLNAENGRGAKVRGGGVAQVATTLYLAVRELDGVVFEEFHSYGAKFSDGYVSDPDDAVLVDYNAGTDLCFTNYGETMRIDLWLDEDSLNCSAGPLSGAVSRGGVLASAATLADGTQARKENILLCALAIDGAVVFPGEEFSFNAVVGPRTAEEGYQNAVNGRGVKVRGGGVAQVASTLYLAVKQEPGLTVTQKRTYGDRYNQNYVSDPDDAIVTDYAAGTDFAFRNDTGAALTVRMTIDANDVLRCELLSEDALWDDDGFIWEDDWFSDDDAFFDEGDGQWVLDDNGEWIWESVWEWIE